MPPLNAADFSNVPTKGLNNENPAFSQVVSNSGNGDINLKEPPTNSSKVIASNFTKIDGDNVAASAQLLRLSIRDGEYIYAKPDDIIMIESSNHLTIVHVAQQVGKVKRTI